MNSMCFPKSLFRRRSCDCSFSRFEDRQVIQGIARMLWDSSLSFQMARSSERQNCNQTTQKKTRLLRRRVAHESCQVSREG